MAPFSADDLTRHAASLRALARDLLADDALAEEAVQQACVTALTRPPTGVGSVAAWLRAVVRNCAFDLRRAEQRRRRREQLASGAELIEPGGARDPAEQLELQEDILAAVRSLDEPYRSAVWLRYYEHKAPLAIAQALSVSVKTVKTRLGRALQLLRHKLDHRYGSRAKWGTSLMPLARRSGRPGVIAALAAGEVLMHGKALSLAAVAAVLVTVAGWWTCRESTGPLPAAGGDPAVVEAAGAGATGASALPLAPLERALVPGGATRPSSAYGSLLVRVRWHDGTPAADVAIDAIQQGERQVDRNELRVVADAEGIARLDRVHEGKVDLSSDRGGKCATEVVAGALREVDFVLSRGVDIVGIVSDDRDQPLANAQVVLVSPRPGWLGGRTVAVSGDDGRFAVRAVDATWSLGARSAGRAPSALVDLEDVEPRADGAPRFVQLRLLRVGADVAGKVVDESNAPIANASVVLGRGLGGHYEPPRVRETWSPLHAVTGVDGAFRCDGVEPGVQPIVASAEGCCRASATLTCVAGGTARITLVLARGVLVRGTVRNEAGAPVADAIVTTVVGDLADYSVALSIREGRTEVRRPRARSNATGSFELRGAPAGTAHLVAAKEIAFGQFEGVCQATLTGRAGDELEWNPVLLAGKTLRVRVVDAEGKPTMLGGTLHAYSELPAGPASRLQVFGEGLLGGAANARPQEGLYVFTNCADVPYTLAARVQHPPNEPDWIYRRGVVAGGPEVELRLPSKPPPAAPGEVTGRIAAAAPRHIRGSLVVCLATRWGVQHAELDGDRFRIADVAPGQYRLWVRADDVPLLVGESFEVRAGQKLDLGDVAIQPAGSVRVALRVPGSVALETAAADLNDGLGRHPLQWDGTDLVAENVTVGRHRLVLRTGGWFAPPLDVDVVADQERRLSIEIVPGALRRFRITMPLPDQWSRCDFAVMDAAGQVLARSKDVRPSLGFAPHSWHVDLPLVPCTLEAMLDGQRRAWPFDLADPSSEPEIRLSLR